MSRQTKPNVFACEEEWVMMTMPRKAILIASFFVLSIGSALAAKGLQPFVLAYKTTGEVTKVAADVKNKLTAAGFQIVGEYSPYAGADVIVVTNDTLKTTAAKSERGGYGAAERVAVTKNGDDIEVSYANPVYMAAAYRMASDLADVRAQLEKALGAESEFGSEKGLTAKDLRKYHYTVMMEYFDDPSELAEYDSHEEAVKAVEAGLAAGAGGTAEVYRIDIPGTEETVFGVALKGVNADDCSSDEFIMSRIDKSTPRHTAHLPYEILVNGSEVEALYGRFRLAMDWPDLPMVASESGATFFSIMCSPNAIEEALIKASGGEE
jgi:hypothetical protein